MQRDVPDVAIKHHRLDLLGGDLLARDGQVEGLAAALDGELDGRAGWPADARDLVLDRRAIDALAVHCADHVARLQARPIRRRSGDGADHHEHAIVRERGAGGQVGGLPQVLDRHLGADAAEPAR